MFGLTLKFRLVHPRIVIGQFCGPDANNGTSTVYFIYVCHQVYEIYREKILNRLLAQMIFVFLKFQRAYILGLFKKKKRDRTILLCHI